MNRRDFFKGLAGGIGGLVVLFLPKETKSKPFNLPKHSCGNKNLTATEAQENSSYWWVCEQPRLHAIMTDSNSTNQLLQTKTGHPIWIYGSSKVGWVRV